MVVAQAPDEDLEYVMSLFYAMAKRKGVSDDAIQAFLAHCRSLLATIDEEEADE